MRKQCILTAVVQNIKRLMALCSVCPYILVPCICVQMQGTVNRLNRNTKLPYKAFSVLRFLRGYSLFP